jgi:hypothetical protein
VRRVVHPDTDDRLRTRDWRTESEILDNGEFRQCTVLYGSFHLRYPICREERTIQVRSQRPKVEEPFFGDENGNLAAEVSDACELHDFTAAQ